MLQAMLISLWGTVFGTPAIHPATFQGYVEGEYVRLAAPAAGTLRQLHVARGNRIRAGDLVFQLDDDAERAARDRAEARLHQAEAQLENLRKGKRETEIDAIEAQRSRASAALRLSEAELRRQEQLFKTGVIGQAKLDQARSQFESDRAQVAEMTAQIQTARLAARSDEIVAAEAAIGMARADLADANWKLSRRSLRAPADALVEDTLFRVGEEIAVGAPVVSLLPAANIKIRFFVPEPVRARVAIGSSIEIRCDACPNGITARVTYIAPNAEYTPPVIYSNESRYKLVYLIEAYPDALDFPLYPGQPIDVRL